MQVFLNHSKHYIDKILYTYKFGNISKVKVIFRQNLTNREWTEVPCKCQGKKKA